MGRYVSQDVRNARKKGKAGKRRERETKMLLLIGGSGEGPSEEVT